MWKWLWNTKTASALGFLILIALIWFVGPFAGLPSSEGRLIAIFAVMLVWVFSLLVGRVLTEHGGKLLEKVIRRETDEAVMAASSDKRAEVTRLRQRMLSAIDTLKTSNIGKARGRAALYELPWYMVIGHPAAGKSSAILHSGLTFPFGDKQAVQGVGGTRDCDWFFSTEGVLLDTAGRYSTQREDRSEWLAFLKLLKKHRSKAPVNGIIVAISFPELMQHRSEQFTLYARQVRERINEIDDAFGIKVPVYLLFTKIDLLGGFAPFFEDLTEEDRQKVWGATLSHDQGDAFDAKRVVCQQFDELYRGLAQLGIEKLTNNRISEKRPAWFAFPIEFSAMRDAISRFVELLFQDDPYHSKPLLRGFYFTSALQEGTPRIAAGNRVAAQFDLSRQGFDMAQLPVSNGFFLRKLFSEVLFPDQHLVTRQLAKGNSRACVAAVVVGIAALALLTGGLTWSYVGNQKLIASAEEELQLYRKLSQAADLSEKLKALQVLQLRLEQLYQYRKNGKPFYLGMSLYQGDKLEQVLRTEYFTGMKKVMLLPVKENLERNLIALCMSPASRTSEPVIPSRTAMPHAEKAAISTTAPGGPRGPSDGGRPVIPIGFPMQEAGDAGYASHILPDRHEFKLDRTLPATVRSNTRGAASIEHVPSLQTSKEKNVIAGAGNKAQATSQQPLDEGYNALKTYLMLEQKEKMDVAHLSDQIPKYWRSWLEANKGLASQDEINRLAERVVAFYVSQLAEPDLPLIENRPDVVATSRDVLRGALHRLSASERVYNELKARANTQFPPLTVGRIINNSNLNFVVGSHAVPGAFTRAAWEKYVRNALNEASKGEIKGEDWVLAATTTDDLARSGNAERNRAELETLYKAEYAREWQKFLQGVAVQDFGTLDNAVLALGHLSDARASAVKLIFAKAAYETAWDNPSRLTASIQSAKNSVIERTEKLVLGNVNTPTSSSPVVPLGEVGTKFALLATMTDAAGEARAPLAAYLDALGKLKTKLAQVATSGDYDAAARQLMQSTLAGSGSEFVEALALIDNVLLANAPEESKEIVRPLLVRPLTQAYAALIPAVERDINRAWQDEVLGTWRALSNKYPFVDSANEASTAEIAKFMRPTEGVFSKFIGKNLAGLLTRRGDVWMPRTWANLGIRFNPAFISAIARLSSAGNSVTIDGDGARFELQPIPTPGIREIQVEIDGQILHYRNGPQPWTGFSWPNPADPNVQASRIQIVSFSGVSTSVASHTGRLSLMRLLAQAKADDPSSPTVQLEWRFKRSSTGIEQVFVGGRGVSGDEDSDVVRINFRMVSGTNPLSLSNLRRMTLPEKITN